MLIFPLAGFVVKSLENTGSYTIASHGYRMRAPGARSSENLNRLNPLRSANRFEITATSD
jgi:hypothetical protein